jgi:hypothetical protein
VLGAAPYVGASGAAFGPAGAVLSPLAALVTTSRMTQISSARWRIKNVPFSSFAPQMALHAALGSEPDKIPAAEALRYGVGQASNAVRYGAGEAVDTISSILKALSNPQKPEKVPPPGSHP